jgi:hypothetical protein
MSHSLKDGFPGVSLDVFYHALHPLLLSAIPCKPVHMLPGLVHQNQVRLHRVLVGHYSLFFPPLTVK